MRIAEALGWLDSHQNLEGHRANRMRSGGALPVAGQTDGLSLAAMTELMTALGDPHLAFRSIHVTGTNGKGSVTRFADAILRNLGLSVARYTSPHLERLNERIVWDGREITDDELAAVLTLLSQIAPTLEQPLSYFELLTAAAFVWFAEVGAEVAVVEVGSARALRRHQRDRRRRRRHHEYRKGPHRWRRWLARTCGLGEGWNHHAPIARDPRRAHG